MLKDLAPKGRDGSVDKARVLRRTMSPPEVMLWQVLRARPGGLKFRRQHPSGPYILDFYCSDARLAIEVDGAEHDGAERATRDAVRDRWMAERGVLTLRVPAREVLRDLDAVRRGVVAACRARLPLHHPASQGGPPPRDELGED